MLPGWCCIAIAALELGNGDSWYLIPHVRLQVPFLGPESHVPNHQQRPLTKQWWKKAVQKMILCRSVSVKSTGSTAWLGFARSCSISSANFASMEATYCSNAHDHSRHAAISLSLLVCSNVGGFGNSLHHCLLSSVEVLETPSTALVAPWAARAAASAACTIRRATSMPSTPSTPGVAATAAGDPPTCGESMSPISASSSKKLSKENQISHFRSAANSLSTPGKLYPQSSTCIFQSLCLDLRPTSIYPEFQYLPVVF